MIRDYEVNKLSEYELLSIDYYDIIFASDPDYNPSDVLEDFKWEANL